MIKILVQVPCFIKHLLCARHCSKHWAWMISYRSQNSSLGGRECCHLHHNDEETERQTSSKFEDTLLASHSPSISHRGLKQLFVVKTRNGNLESKPSFAADLLCDLGQVTFPLWAYVFLNCKLRGLGSCEDPSRWGL